MVLPASVEDIDWLGNSVTKIKLSEKSKVQNGQKISDSMVWSSPNACAQSSHGQYSSQCNREALALMVRKCLGFETLTFQRDPVSFPARSAIGERNKKLQIIMTGRNSAPEKLHDYSLSNLKTSLSSLDSKPLKLTYLNKK